MCRQQKETPPRPLARCSASWQRTFCAALCQPDVGGCVGGGADSWDRASSLAASLAAVPSRQSDRFAKAARKLCEAVPSKITYAFFRMLLPSAGERWARLSADFAACFTDVGSAAAEVASSPVGFLSCFTMAALQRARGTGGSVSGDAGDPVRPTQLYTPFFYTSTRMASVLPTSRPPPLLLLRKTDLPTSLARNRPGVPLTSCSRGSSPP